MDTVYFYLLACLPVLVGGALWLFDRHVNWVEWLGSSVASFVFAGIFHLIAISGQTSDVETWSGQLTGGRHIPRWEEYYEYAVYRTEIYYTTDSKGNSSMHTRQVFDHWEPTTRWHDNEYHVWSNIDTSYGVSHDFYYQIAQTFGGFHPAKGTRTTYEHNSRMIGGDPNDYLTENKTGYIWPVTKHVDFENRIKATPTTFSFAKVPPTIKVFGYPENRDSFHSNRLIGTASTLDWFQFDQMNARLGPAKLVNVILVGFGDRDSMAAEWQKAAWIGGKKNDVVICYGGPNDRPTWVVAFGWTDSKTCLHNLETVVLDNGVKNETFRLIESMIVQGYTLKNWRAFDYIRIPARPWAFWTYLAVLIVTQVGFWLWANYNEFDKEDGEIRLLRPREI